jgi:hypothetical protein
MTAVFLVVVLSLSALLACLVAAGILPAKCQVALSLVTVLTGCDVTPRLCATKNAQVSLFAPFLGEKSKVSVVPFRLSKKRTGWIIFRKQISVGKTPKKLASICCP